jgi:hypothetical protein
VALRRRNFRSSVVVILSGAQFPDRAAPAVFYRSAEMGIFQRGNRLLNAQVVFYSYAEHRVVYFNNIKKSTNSEFRWSKKCSAKTISPESNQCLKSTWTDAISKKIVFKMKFSLKINFKEDHTN